jgi:hypothetical protein
MPVPQPAEVWVVDLSKAAKSGLHSFSVFQQ